MKKNIKGFTLIELLGVIVILGIISVFSVSELFGMIEKNRDKMYISDAKKMVSKAEYMIRSNKIEPPSYNKYIVISLNYLDDGEFDNAPNGGTYDKEKSFVVVKNYGILAYYVIIVEKLKGGGYKGFGINTSALLTDKNKRAFNYISVFKEDDLIDLSTITDYNSLCTYLQAKLSETCNNNYIEEIYK